MSTRLLTIVAMCILNSTIFARMSGGAGLTFPPKAAAATSGPVAPGLPWPRKGVSFPDDGVLQISMGSADAPVVITEISSATCYHCARFHQDVFPPLKKKYIDTGKVRYVIRHCPIDGASLRAAMVLYKLPKTKRLQVLEKLWKTQPKWFPNDFSAKGLEKMAMALAHYGGLSVGETLSYLKDDGLAEKMVKDRMSLDQRIQIDGTPTFIINGDVILVASSLKNMDDLITMHLKKGRS